MKNEPITETESFLNGKLWCFYVSPSANEDGQGFIPSIVICGDDGHYPLKGKGRHSIPWRWGETLEEAKSYVDTANERRGIPDNMAMLIVTSSIAPNERNIKAAKMAAKNYGIKY